MTAPLKIPKMFDPEELIPTRVEVTQEMINDSSYMCHTNLAHAPTSCVMYEALKNLVKVPFAVGSIAIVILKEEGSFTTIGHIYFSQEVFNYIKDFDDRRTIQPTTFTIDIPRKYLK